MLINLFLGFLSVVKNPNASLTCWWAELEYWHNKNLYFLPLFFVIMKTTFFSILMLCAQDQVSCANCIDF
jgi:hypothetical protein